MGILSGLFDYLGTGVHFTSGSMVVSGTYSSVNTQIRDWGGIHYGQATRTGGMPTPINRLDSDKVWTQPKTLTQAGPLATPHHQVSMHGQTFGVPGERGLAGKKAGGFGRLLGPTVGLGSSAYFAYLGYQQNGMEGVYDSLMLDVGVGAGVSAQGYTRSYYNTAGESVTKKWAMKNPNSHLKLTRARTGFLGSALLTGAATMMGAYHFGGIGQDIGNQMGAGMGTMGTIAGALLGARVARNPLALLTYGAALVGGSAVVKGTYDLLKTGYRRKQFMRQAHTAGDTAAFMTNSAVTMRQRSVSAIQKSHANARSALGMEAGYMHMPKNYFSTYNRYGNMM